MVKWLQEEKLASDFIIGMNWANLDASHLKQDILDAFEAPISELFLRYTKKELFAEALKRDIFLFLVSTVSELCDNEQLKARGAYEKVEHPELGEDLVYPSVFAKVPDVPLKLRCRAPLPGEHNADIYCAEMGLSQQELSSLEKAGVRLSKNHFCRRPITDYRLPPTP